MRLALEGLATERAAIFIKPSDIAELEKLRTVINRGLDQKRYKDVLRANRSFHFLI